MRIAGAFSLLAVLAVTPHATAAMTSSDYLVVPQGSERNASFHFRSIERIYGDDGRSFREALDVDADGMVSTSEVHAYEAARSTMNIRGHGCARQTGFLSIDDTPTAVGMVVVDVDGALGRIDRSGPIDHEVTVWFGADRGLGMQDDIVVRLALRHEISAAFQCILQRHDGPFLHEGPPDVFEVFPLTGGSWDLSRASVTPSAAKSLYGQRLEDNAHNALHSIRADTPGDIQILWDNELRFHQRPEMPGWAVPFVELLEYAAAAVPFVALTFAVAAGTVVVTEYGRYRVASWIAASGLFSRIEKHKALDHARRDTIVQLVRQNPGIRFSDMKKQLGVGSGVLVHHLRVLEREGFVRAKRDRFRTRFYAPGHGVPQGLELTDRQRDILAAVSAHPGIGPSELADRLGLNRGTVHHHAKRLAAMGKLEIEGDGRDRRLRPA